MAEAFDTANEAIDSLEGDETYDEAEYPLRDFASKEVSVFLSTRVRALEEGVLPPGSVDAEDVAFTPTGTIAATDVQAAIAEVAAEAGGGGGFPTNHFILAMTPAKAHSNFDNFESTTSTTTRPFGVRTSDDTNGAWIEWYVTLAAGDWALTAKGWPWPGGGILVFSLSDDGGTSRDDIDDPPYGASAASYQGYSDPETPDQVGQVVASDITIATGGEYVLRATVTGKHASSTGHATNLTWVQLSKVGA